MLVGVASLPAEHRHFTVETGKTAYNFATQCTSWTYCPNIYTMLSVVSVNQGMLSGKPVAVGGSSR